MYSWIITVCYYNTILNLIYSIIFNNDIINWMNQYLPTDFINENEDEYYIIYGILYIGNIIRYIIKFFIWRSIYNDYNELNKLRQENNMLQILLNKKHEL